MNLLTNPGFEGGWTRKTHTGQEFGEIFVPEGWVAYWREGGTVPHDPDNTNGYGRPEMHVINREPPFLDPPRIRGGNRALKFFTFYRIHDGGVYQPVTGITPGARLRARGWAHAWSAVTDDPRRSSLDGNGGLNFTFRLGIDPRGGTDPWSDQVIWGPGGHLYDVYGEIPALEIVAEAETVTLFVRSTVLWPFKHCDAYVDDVSLNVVDQPQPPADGPVPGGYPATAMVVDYGLIQDPARRSALYSLAAERGVMVGPSHDHVRAWPPGAGSYDVELYDIPADHRDAFRAYYAERSPHINLVFPSATIPEPEPEPEPQPDPSWRPRNYVPRGTKLGFHGVGDGGQSGDIFAPLLPLGACPPTAKIVVSLGAAGDILRTGARPTIIGRVIDHPQWHNLEWFNYDGDPVWQAEDRMARLMAIWAPFRESYTYWEIINEQKPPTSAYHVKLATFYIWAMQIAEANGYRLALFGHSVGTPEPRDWTAIADTGVFEAAAAGGHAISLHEYGDMNLNVGSHLLRYRDLYERIILPRQLDIPLYITEYNLWRETLPHVDSAYLFDQWMRYDAHVAQDPYVAGVHIYSVGEISDDYRTAIYALYPRFREYAVATRDRLNA